ncbi:hypothetical protein BH11ARM1_BH11ARM1_06950 [soil metagenome]
MKTRHFLLGAFACFAITGCGGSKVIGTGGGFGANPVRGDLVSSKMQSTWTTGLLNFALSFGGTTAITATSQVVQYSITYNTVDINGNPTVASGSVCYPVGATSVGLVSYQHSTATAKSQVPSVPGYEEAIFIMAAYPGCGNYALSMPDYLGLGSNPGLHPFLNAQTEASASADCLIAAKQLLAKTSGAPALNGKVFLTGYSQGGHSTMALARSLQTISTITAVAPGDGPYDISNTELNFAYNNPGPDTPTLLAYIAVAYNPIYNLYSNASDAFQSPYDANVPPLFGKENGLDDIASWCPTEPTELFQPAFTTELKDTTSVANLSLQANNVYAWVPNMPLKMFHAESDNIVSYQNAVVALAKMQALGAANVSLVNTGTGMTHTQAFVPATVGSRLWFDTF